MLTAFAYSFCLGFCVRLLRWLLRTAFATAFAYGFGSHGKQISPAAMGEHCNQKNARQDGIGEGRTKPPIRCNIEFAIRQGMALTKERIRLPENDSFFASTVNRITRITAIYCLRQKEHGVQAYLDREEEHLEVAGHSEVAPRFRVSSVTLRHACQMLHRVSRDA